MIRNFNHFNNPVVGRSTAKLQSLCRKLFTVIIVNLVAVPVSFVNQFLTVSFIGLGINIDFTRIFSDIKSKISSRTVIF